MRRAPALALALCLLLAGCATAPRSATPLAAPKPGEGGSAVRLQPSLSLTVGRVLAVDEKAQTVIVDVSPYATLPADLTGQTLLARDPASLLPTARLQASPYQRGRTLGTRLLEGHPALGDEIVLPPPAVGNAATPAPAP